MGFRDAFDRFRGGRGRGGRPDVERFYGTDSREPYSGRDYGHSGGFTNSGYDFDRDTPRHDDWNSDWNLDANDDFDGDFDDRYSAPSPRFGANMQGSFGYDRGGEGARGGSYFGHSDRGSRSNVAIARGEANLGGDVDRGFSGGSIQGGVDRGYSGGLNYGFGGGAYRGGIGHDRGPEQSRPSYRGRGPKGYVRSDERIRELISERLAEHDAIDATDIDVVVSNGEVTLTGTIDSRRNKRLAEDVADSVLGVRDVHNQLRVQPTASPLASASTGTDGDETLADSEQKATERTEP